MLGHPEMSCSRPVQNPAQRLRNSLAVDTDVPGNGLIAESQLIQRQCPFRDLLIFWRCLGLQKIYCERYLRKGSNSLRQCPPSFSLDIYSVLQLRRAE
jgi:hypothetical protein